MNFDPGLTIEQALTHKEMFTLFQCSNAGGIRPSSFTRTVVIIAYYTNKLYNDRWENGILHYTGMGKSGDQDFQWAHNATLAGYRNQAYEWHLFEVYKPNQYVYRGKVKLAYSPYKEIQPDKDGMPRKVCMFPLKLISD